MALFSGDSIHMAAPGWRPGPPGAEPPPLCSCCLAGCARNDGPVEQHAQWIGTVQLCNACYFHCQRLQAA